MSSTDIDAGRPEMNRIVVWYMHSRANISGVVTRTVSSGSMPRSCQSVQAMNAARIRSAPWATLITSITPKISASPPASSA